MDNFSADPMTAYYLLGSVNVALAGLAALRKTGSGARKFWIAAGICWTLQAACYFYTAGLSSLSGVAPTFCLSALVLVLWQWPNLISDYEARAARPRINAVLLGLLAAASLAPEPYRNESFMMGYLFAQLFFLSRPLSLGLTLFALGGARDCLGKDPSPGMLFQSQKAALLAGLIFLGGEISGCYWGFMGWGTTWRWSGNFYFSAMIFVLYMMALHVPRSLFPSARAYAWGFFLPLIVAALAMTLSKVVNL